MEQTLSEEKKRLRSALSDPKTWNTSVSLSSFFEFYTKDLRSKPVGLYKPLKDEIKLSDTSLVSRPAWPKILDASESSMIFSKTEHFVKSTLGFSEPKDEASTEVEKEELGVIFVPGQAFDFKGARLGRGKGYYDRYLSDYKGIKVGVCHWTRFLNRPIPVDRDHDVFMDYILTDRHLYKVNDAAKETEV